MEEKKVPSAVATKQPDDEQKKEEKYLLDSEEKIEIAMKNENRKSPFLFPRSQTARAHFSDVADQTKVNKRNNPA